MRRVVDEHVQAALPFDRRPHHPAARFDVGEIAADETGFMARAAQLLAALARPLALTPMHDDGGAERGENAPQCRGRCRRSRR